MYLFMITEKFKAANYAELLALDSTIFETICDNGTIPSSFAISSEPQPLSMVTKSDLTLLQDRFETFIHLSGVLTYNLYRL